MFAVVNGLQNDINRLLTFAILKTQIRTGKRAEIISTKSSEGDLKKVWKTTADNALLARKKTRYLAKARRQDNEDLRMRSKSDRSEH